jgi:uncharacterized protein YndB with AHSA1/START domain
VAEPTAHSSIDIAAPPELVYRIVSDVTGLPEWAEETERCVWLGGATGPAVGAQFRGVNRHKGRRWAMKCTVTEATEDPQRCRFAFQVSLLGVPTAVWSYDIEATERGCRVTESTRRLAPDLPTKLVNRYLLGVPDRDRHNQRNIERTLQRLKEYAERQAANSADV